MKPERGDHILIALVCLVASLASIIGVRRDRSSD
jgi:hypothetical protein